MRHISFALTTKQFRDGSKTVTRRLGWRTLKVGEQLLGVEKCQGLKKGERVVPLGALVVLSVGREPLSAITQEDCRREGFPALAPAEFVAFFCRTHRGCGPETEVTRIEFRRVEP